MESLKCKMFGCDNKLIKKFDKSAAYYFQKGITVKKVCKRCGKITKYRIVPVVELQEVKE
jgi:hypothetical protein